MTLSWIAFAIGFFYVAGGVLVTRQLALDIVLDDALEMLGSKDTAQERLRTQLLTIGAALTFASGLSLMALSRAAPAIFACAALLHGGYLLWAARACPPQDLYEAQGRRAMIRAFLFFLAAFAFVLYAGGRGIWREWLEPAFLELAAIAALSAVTTWLLQRPARRKTAPRLAAAGDDRRAGEIPVPEGFSGLDALVKHVHRGLSFHEPPSDERVAEAAAQCGVAEIEEIIERLDSLAREKDALPQWDGDSSDDIHDGQKFLARLLAAVAPRYEAALRRGLESREDQTRRWVEIALRWRKERLECGPPERGDDTRR